LNEWVNRAANGLAALGYRRGDALALHTTRLGIPRFKTGGNRFSSNNARVALRRIGMLSWGFTNLLRKCWGVVRPCTELADRQHGLVSSDCNGEFLHEPRNSQGRFGHCQLSADARMLAYTKG
jgi:hypothetical protein